jgi:hypothetical protein
MGIRGGVQTVDVSLSATDPNVQIELIREDEDDSPDGNFEDAETVQWVRDQLASGNEWAWFAAHVRVTYRGLTVSEYLGACSYESESAFRKGGYFDDMVKGALERIETQIKNR